MKKILAMILVLTTVVCTIFTVFTMTSCAKDDNTLVCGVTIFKNMNEQKDGVWTGFEVEFAQEVGKILGMDVKFQIIDWSQKYNELNSGAIDCIWNGFTANSSDNGIKRSDLVDFSYGYMINYQCVVVREDKLDALKTKESLKGKKACVEGGSAGETYAKTLTGEDNIMTAQSQLKAFPEVKSGAADFAVVDILLAREICGQGDNKDLVIVDSIELEREIYAIGFKKGSKLTEKVNKAIKQLEENGKLLEIAKKYQLEDFLEIREKIN